MRLRAVTLLVLLTCCVSCLSCGKPQSALDLMVGRWKEDESKRDLSDASPLMFRMGPKNIEEVRSGEVTEHVEAVVFDGEPHVSEGNTSIVWRQIDVNTFERRLTEDGRLMTVRTLRLSNGGNTLTETINQTGADGKPTSVELAYQRIDGANGLVGRWKPTSVKSTAPAERYIERAGPTSFTYRTSLGVAFTAVLDGNPVPQTGPGVVAGTMSAARLSGPRAIEITTIRDGSEISRTELRVSDDGKTLTESSRTVAANASGGFVQVFTKE